MNYRWHVPSLIAFITLFFQASHAQDTVLEGRAMGMPYRIVVADRLREGQREAIRASVLDILDIAESTFSLYRADSEIMRWNENTSTDWIPVSRPLADLVKHSRMLYDATDGAFDPTIRPLIKLWQFDKIAPQWVPPTSRSIAACLEIVGMHRIHLRESPAALKKDLPSIELDLNSLVEGWCLDQIAVSIQAITKTNFLASLGGEHVGLGLNSHGKPWRIMIEPTAGDEKKSENKPNPLFQVQLTDLCISTSGTYRSGHYHEGQWFGHVLDARTGHPIPREKLLASVVAKSALEADGWSTALLTLDEELSKSTCDEFKIASLLIYETDQGLQQMRSELGQTFFLSTVSSPASAPRHRSTSATWIFLASILVAAIFMVSIRALRFRSQPTA
jgi:thiamine biosynthesis lipoprotein